MDVKKYISLCGKTSDGADFTELSNVPFFSVMQTFDCGQCFRFNVICGNDGEFADGVVFG